MSFGVEEYGGELFVGSGYPAALRMETLDINGTAFVGGDPLIPTAPLLPYEPRWLGVGKAVGLVPLDNQSGEWMYELLPEWYRTMDENTPGHPSIPAWEGWGQLRRFIEIFGQMYDNLRSETETIANIYDPTQVRVGLIKQFSEMFGFQYDPNIGSAPQRSLLANWFYILKHKGTYPATKTFVESITNYPTSVVVGTSQMLSTNDSEGRETGGFWHSTGNDLISAVTLMTPYIAKVNTALHATCVSDAATPQPMRYIDADVSTARSVQLTAIPLQKPTHKHFYQLAFKWYDVVNFDLFMPTLTIDWYDGNGVFISSDSNGGLGSSAFTTGGWTIQWFDNATPPAGTKYAVLGWTLPYPGAGKRLRFTGVQFTDDTFVALPWMGVYEPPDVVKIRLYPTRINYFPNPNFDGPNMYFDRVSGQYDVVQTTEQANPLTYATHSMKVTLDPLVTTTNVTSQMIGPNPFTDTIRVPPFTSYTAGDVWSFMISVLPGNPPNPAATPQPYTETVTPFITLYYPDGHNEMVKVDVEEPNLQYVWTQLHVSAAVPTGGLDHIEVGVIIDGAPAGGNSVYYFDSVVLERNTFPYFYGYFDGDTDDTSADFSWATDAKDSASLYYPNRYMRERRLRALLPSFLPPTCAFEIFYALPTS